VIWVLGNWHGAGAEVLVNGHNPEAKDSKTQLRIRKDILLLSEEEIQVYREKLDDIGSPKALVCP
jgi:hypothetical protein